MNPHSGSGVILRLSNDLCNDCQTFLGHIISNSYAATSWRTIDGGYDCIKYFDNHHQGDTDKLVRSGNAGCQICGLLFRQLSRCAEPHVGSYYIFVKPRTTTNPHFYVCRGDVSRFTQSMQVWENDQARQLMITGESASNSATTTDPSKSTVMNLPLDVSEIKLPRLIGGDLSSEDSFEIVKKWLNDCINNHKSCPRDSSFLPKRLLDLVDLETTGIIYLRLPTEIDKWSYATISYTWGPKGKKRLKTENNNPEHPELTESSHCAGTAFSKFPPTLQDAIKIAKGLGFRYVWIDSICIVQDSTKDWMEQSAAMTQIYEGGSLNISAATSEHSEWGILRPVKRSDIQIGDMYASEINYELHKSGALYHRRIYVGDYPGLLDLEEMALAKRGWIFQERLVSVATIHYSDQGLIWECGHGVKLDHDRQFNRFPWKQQWRSSMYSLPSFLTTRTPHYVTQGRARILQQWKEWVAAYAARELYDFEDRLPAIAGVAKTINREFQLDYAAGLWQQDLIGGLMWKRFQGSRSLKRFKDDKTPSWSWASVQGRLLYVHKVLQESFKAPNVEVIGNGAKVEEEKKEKSDLFGRVKYGHICVIGMLQEVTIDKSIHPGSRQRDWNEVSVRSGFINATNVEVTLDDPSCHDGNLIRCWCLRLGSVDDDGREGDVFLLLEKFEESTNQFRRIGFVETEPWFESSFMVPDSGMFTAASLCELVLV